MSCSNCGAQLVVAIPPKHQTPPPDPTPAPAPEPKRTRKSPTKNRTSKKKGAK